MLVMLSNVNLRSQPGPGTQVSLDTCITRQSRDNVSWRWRTGRTAWLALSKVHILWSQVHKQVLNTADGDDSEKNSKDVSPL